MLLRVDLAIDASRYVRSLLQETRVLVDHATVDVHVHLLRAEEHVHVVHVLRRRVPGRRHHEHARAQRGVLCCGDLFRRGSALPVDEGERHAECAGEQRVCVDGRSGIWSENTVSVIDIYRVVSLLLIDGGVGPLDRLEFECSTVCPILTGH